MKTCRLIDLRVASEDGRFAVWCARKASEVQGAAASKTLRTDGRSVVSPQKSLKNARKRSRNDAKVHVQKRAKSRKTARAD
eukprot:6193390-Pleurochrysis_carterae.AAC.1